MSSTPPSAADALPPIDQLLRARRTIKLFRTDPVPEALLDRALESAHFAPNHKLSLPWRFTKVGRQTRAQLVPIAQELKAAQQGCASLSPLLQAQIHAKMMDAPWLVVIRQRLSDDPFRAQEDRDALACATHNIMLSLHGAGVGSKWGTGAITRDRRAYEILGVPADTEQIFAFLYVGYAQRTPPGRRPPFEGDFVRSLP